MFFLFREKQAREREREASARRPLVGLAEEEESMASVVRSVKRVEHSAGW
jgi:hypothetical protein